MNATSIGWTDYTANLIRYRDADGKDVWACAKTSSGCAFCYSEALAKRYGKGGPFTEAEVRKVTPYFAEGEAKKLLTAKKLTGKRVFCGDMTDVFGSWVPDELLDRMFAVFALRPDVVFQVLTKRAERMAAYFSEKWQPGVVTLDGKDFLVGPIDREGQVKEKAMSHFLLGDLGDDERFWLEDGSSISTSAPWPLPNVWLGVSVENQAAADERIPHLPRAPAAVRFLSVEPLLGPVDLTQWFRCEDCQLIGQPTDRSPTVSPEFERCGRGETCPLFHWVIVGGESGPRRRPMELAWLESVVRQCRAAGVPCFVKQDSALRPGRQGRIPDALWSVKEFPKC